ncbi:MAG: hypothetical protein K0Q90_260 [Paenibacillaceae bacterium]|nr:hypothetical protein [Paenibacillaceae bacterium]
MQLIEYYHRLHTELPEARGGLPVTLERLSGIFYCSERNVKFILHKMAAQSWIVWKPGRGRGNHSELVLLEDSGTLIRKEAMRLVQEENIKQALELVGLPGMEPGEKEAFFQWLGGAFGFQEVSGRSRPLEVLRLPYYAPLLTMDPTRMIYSKDMHLVRQLFDTLVRVQPESGKVMPHLAHHWEFSGDGMLWTFYLRKGVRFHHGREMTAEDAVFSLLRLKEAGSRTPFHWLVQGVEQVRAVGGYIMEVELSAPNYMFDRFASSAGLSIVPKDSYSRGQHYAPVGTGPFRLVEHDVSMCILEAFPDYFKERALLDRVELWVLPSGMKVTPQLRISDWGGSPRQGAESRQGEESLSSKLTGGLTKGCNFMSFNIEQPGPQQNRLFREAVHLLLDRQAFIREIKQDGSLPAQGLLPQGNLPPDDADPCHDLTEGLRLLAESGYRGETLKLMLNTGHVAMAEWIARWLGQYGIAVKLDVMSREEAAGLKWVKNAQCYVGGLVADEDRVMFLLELLYAGHYSGFFLHKELQQEMEERLRSVQQEPGADARRNQLAEVQALLARDRDVIFLIHPANRIMYSPTLRGVTVNTLGQVDFKDLWFLPETFSQDSPSRT